MRMLGVVVDDSDPFERCANPILHSADEISRERLQVEAIAELWGENQLEQTLILRGLPFRQALLEIDAGFGLIEGLIVSDGGIAFQVAAMRSPLSFGLVR